MFNMYPFYNFDDRESLSYHQQLRKIAEQERLARQAMQAREHHPASRHKIALKERILRLISFILSHNIFALKNQKYEPKADKSKIENIRMLE